MVSTRESVHFEAAAVPRAALGGTSLMLSVQATATWLAESPGACALEVRQRAGERGRARPRPARARGDRGTRVGSLHAREAESRPGRTPRPGAHSPRHPPGGPTGPLRLGGLPYPCTTPRT
jgi:hypothetical protein